MASLTSPREAAGAAAGAPRAPRGAPSPHTGHPFPAKHSRWTTPRLTHQPRKTQHHTSSSSPPLAGMAQPLAGSVAAAASSKTIGSGSGSVDDYHVIELVGEGSFGKVYKARRKFTGQITAMKFIAKHGKTEKDIKSLRQEIEILRGWGWGGRCHFTTPGKYLVFC